LFLFLKNNNSRFEIGNQASTERYLEQFLRLIEREGYTVTYDSNATYPPPTAAPNPNAPVLQPTLGMPATSKRVKQRLILYIIMSVCLF
jgi:hypothetical protein